MKNEALFRTGSVWKSIFSMAVPSIIIILVMVLYNMADMFFVGGDLADSTTHLGNVTVLDSIIDMDELREKVTAVVKDAGLLA